MVNYLGLTFNGYSKSTCYYYLQFNMISQFEAGAKFSFTGWTNKRFWPPFGESRPVEFVMRRHLVVEKIRDGLESGSVAKIAFKPANSNQVFTLPHITQFWGGLFLIFSVGISENLLEN